VEQHHWLAVGIAGDEIVDPPGAVGLDRSGVDREVVVGCEVGLALGILPFGCA